MEADMEAGLIKDPFVAGETVVKKFYCFPFESTKWVLNKPYRSSIFYKYLTLIPT